MNLLYAIAEQAMTRHMNGMLAPYGRPARLPLGLYILAGFMVGAGLLFTMAGAYMGLLAAGVAGYAAALITAAGIFAVVAVLMAGALAADLWRRQKSERLRDEGLATLQSLVESAAVELEEPIRAHPKTAVALAALAGAAAGGRWP
jgi:hypothetical protein